MIVSRPNHAIWENPVSPERGLSGRATALMSRMYRYSAAHARAT